MNTKRNAKLKKAGMVVTDAAAWLGLSPEEAALVEMRLSLAREVEKIRLKKGISQSELSARLGTRQPAIARMENRPQASSLDSLVRALLALGATPRKIAATLV